MAGVITIEFSDGWPHHCLLRTPFMGADVTSRLWLLPALLLSLLEQGSFAQVSGISQRYPNSTLKFPEQPRWSAYSLVNAFGTNTFWKPVCISSPPGETNRVFVLDKEGIIEVVTNIGAQNPQRSVYMDLQAGIAPYAEQGLLGLAF